MKRNVMPLFLFVITITGLSTGCGFEEHSRLIKFDEAKDIYFSNKDYLIALNKSTCEFMAENDLYKLSYGEETFYETTDNGKLINIEFAVDRFAKIPNSKANRNLISEMNSVINKDDFHSLHVRWSKEWGSCDFEVYITRDIIWNSGIVASLARNPMDVNELKSDGSDPYSHPNNKIHKFTQKIDADWHYSYYFTP